MIGNIDFELTYRLESELLQADNLSCIYVQELQSDGSLDPDWPMYYDLMRNDIYPTDVKNKTLEKLVKNKNKFKVDQGAKMLQDGKWNVGGIHTCVTTG